MGKEVVVSSGARVHIALTDVGRATRRAYGGTGFLLNEPRTIVRCKEGDGSATVVMATNPEYEDSVRDVVAAFLGMHPGASGSLEVLKVLPAHCGFGSKTSLLLNCLAALSHFNDIDVSLSQLVRVSRRGGASGVGVNAFWSGGWIFDGGHPQSLVGALLPSSARERFQVPPLLVRIEAPSHWIVHVLLPPGSHISGEEERRFFASNTPVSEIDALRCLAAVYHGILPSVVTSDIESLAQSLKDVRLTAFKRAEVSSQAKSMQLLTEISEIRGVACGMSSFGPLVYAIAEESCKDATDAIHEIADRHCASLIARTCIDNGGYRVDYVEC